MEDSKELQFADLTEGNNNNSSNNNNNMANRPSTTLNDAMER